MEKQIADLNVSGIDKEKISKSIKHKKGMYLTKSFQSTYFFCFHCTAFVFMKVSMNLVNPLKPCKEVTSYRFLYNITENAIGYSFFIAAKLSCVKLMSVYRENLRR